MTTEDIPDALSKPHGGSKAAEIGARWAETFELHGRLTGRDRVLDVGCGPGRMAAAIGRRFGFTQPSYLGFDIKRADIDWCSSNIGRTHPRFEFVHLDIRNAHYNPAGAIEPAAARFPFHDGSADFVFATSVFTHMRTPEMLAYLREAKRCLAANGRFFATFFCVEDDFDGRMPSERDFSTRVDDACRTCRPANPEDAIAYPTAFVMESFAALGLSTEFFRGSWSRLAERTGRHAQDYVVATLR